MKKYILLITTIFFSHSLNAQTDSLYIKELDNIFGTAVDYYYVGKYVESLYELNNIVKPYHLDLKENNEDATLVFVKALTLKSIIYIYLQNYGEAEHILEQAESLSEILTNKKKEKKIWKRRIESAWGEYYLYRMY